MDAGELWSECAAGLRARVSEAAWRRCFSDVQALRLGDGRLLLGVPNSLAKERIESHYREAVQKSLADAGAPEVDIDLVVRTAAPDDFDEVGAAPPGGGTRQDDVADEGTPARQPADHHRADHHRADHHRASDAAAAGSVDAAESGRGRVGARPDATVVGRRGNSGPADPVGLDDINPRYTFEAFVTGPSNRFAHAATMSVAETPGRSYNPLFIYGSAGLGKTHLLHAVAHYLVQNYPQYRVRYVSTETFLNDYVDALRTNTNTEFKRRYRQCDVLLVDDIQFMEGKEGLQEEFFHTFNSLYGGNRQIVLSSDRPPKAIPTLEDRLRSRFEWGLITDIQPPDLETRLAILRKKSERELARVPHEVLQFIAENITDNIRELEGALTRVSAFATLNDEPLTADVARRVLSDMLTGTKPRPITPELILTATAEKFGFTIDDLRSRSRRRPLVTARQVGMYVLRTMTDLSYPAIAREFGGRDHTTVIHAVDKISDLMKERQQIYDQVTELIQEINSGR